MPADPARIGPPADPAAAQNESWSALEERLASRNGITSEVVK